MSRFVFFTGMYNILLGAGFLVPGLPALLGIREPGSHFWLWLLAFAVMYMGGTLLLSSRNLHQRAGFVAYEGGMRLIAAALLIWFGFYGDLGGMAGLLGVIDGLIGIAYLVGLPWFLDRSLKKILLDQVAP